MCNCETANAHGSCEHEDYPEDITRIVSALTKAGYKCSRSDANEYWKGKPTCKVAVRILSPGLRLSKRQPSAQGHGTETLAREAKITNATAADMRFQIAGEGIEKKTGENYGHTR